MLGGHQHVDIISAAHTMVKAAQQAVGVWRKIHTHHISLFIGKMVNKAGILMGIAVVVLLPYIGRQDIIQRGNVRPPRQFSGHLQPFGMLRGHGVHNTDEGLIAVKNTMPPCQQISFQPALAAVLRQHRIHNAPFLCQMLVTLQHLPIPHPF